MMRVASFPLESMATVISSTLRELMSMSLSPWMVVMLLSAMSGVIEVV